MPGPENLELVRLLIKEFGFPVLIFLIWLIYHRSEVQRWERSLESNSAIFREMMAQMANESERQFKLLRETIETMTFHSGQLARIEQKIDANQFCPLTKRNQTS